MNMIIWYFMAGIVVVGINLAEIRCVDPKSWKEFNDKIDGMEVPRSLVSALFILLMTIIWPLLLKDMIMNAIEYYKKRL